MTHRHRAAHLALWIVLILAVGAGFAAALILREPPHVAALVTPGPRSATSGGATPGSATPGST